MAYATDAMRRLADAWEAAIPSAVLSGIVAGPASGDSYHHSANELPSSSYTRQLPGDRNGIDWDAADAIDISMSPQDMRLVTGRIHRSWKDPDDHRLDGWREIIGTLDGVNVIYMDCQDGSQGTADGTHRWHVHAGGLRVNAGDATAMAGLLSVVRNDTNQHLGGDMLPDELTQQNYDGYPGLPATNKISSATALASAERRAFIAAQESRAARAGVDRVESLVKSSVAADRATLTALTALADVIKSGGGDVDVVAILARIDAVAAQESQAVAELHTTIGVLRARLADAAQAEADKLAGR